MPSTSRNYDFVLANARRPTTVACVGTAVSSAARSALSLPLDADSCTSIGRRRLTAWTSVSTRISWKSHSIRSRSGSSASGRAWSAVDWGVYELDRASAAYAPVAPETTFPFFERVPPVCGERLASLPRENAIVATQGEGLIQKIDVRTRQGTKRFELGSQVLDVLVIDRFTS
jgi:hypothetical protein